MRKMGSGVIGLLAIVALAACEPETKEATEAVSETVAVETSEPAVTEMQAGLTGQHCWFHEDENTTEALELTFAEDGTVSGSHYGVIHMEDAGCFAAFDTILSDGQTNDGATFTFASVTEVDGDTQTGAEGWVVSKQSAGMADMEAPDLSSADCATLETRVFGEPIPAEDGEAITP